MQILKKNSLCAEFCSSRAAEQASRIFWIMSEFSRDLHRVTQIYVRVANMGRNVLSLQYRKQCRSTKWLSPNAFQGD